MNCLNSLANDSKVQFSTCDVDYEIREIVKRVVIIAFGFSNLLLPLIIYFVFAKSQQMKNYRFYLLNTTVWCYVYHLIVCLIHPNALYPSSCVLFHPIIEISQNQTVFLFYMFTFSLINLNMSIIWSLLYRFSQVFSNGLAEYFEKSKSIYFLYGITYIFVHFTGIVPITLFQSWDWNQTRSQFRMENPQHTSYIDNPMICFEHGEYFRWFHLYMSIMFILAFILGNLSQAYLFYLLYKTKQNSLVPSTYKYQAMLLKAFSCQLFVAYALLILPVALQSIFVFYNVTFESQTNKLFSETVDNLTMIYFISPWRKTVVSWTRWKKPHTITANQQTLHEMTT
ncbi:hypothetical protein M3Y96_00591000 [Aphelenchoides besseyi]|nr:hypothetical protein M3Y96_00591000 [Aphelenchoides besseyi]